MTVKLKQGATIILQPSDVAAILTEQLCSYNALADLEVFRIVQRKEGDFELRLAPKEARHPPAAKGAAP